MATEDDTPMYLDITVDPRILRAVDQLEKTYGPSFRTFVRVDGEEALMMDGATLIRVSLSSYLSIGTPRLSYAFIERADGTQDTFWEQGLPPGL